MRSLQYGLRVEYRGRKSERGNHQLPYSVDWDKVEEIYRIKKAICAVTGSPVAVTDKWPITL